MTVRVSGARRWGAPRRGFGRRGGDHGVQPDAGGVGERAGHPAKAKAPTAKNVIFINGDGMAAAHREAARLNLAGLDGQLAMDKLPRPAS